MLYVSSPDPEARRGSGFSLVADLTQRRLSLNLATVSPWDFILGMLVFLCTSGPKVLNNWPLVFRRPDWCETTKTQGPAETKPKGEPGGRLD